LALILFTLLLLAIGISGVSISIAVSTTSFEKFVTARGVVYYLLFFCSSVFYPLSVIWVLADKGLSALVVFAQVNPLTNGSDLIRSFLLDSSLGYVFSPLMLLNVAIFSVIFTSLAVFAYSKILQRH
jgi:ABC-type polysaccharide/polyol phosphate export permease